MVKRSLYTLLLLLIISTTAFHAQAQQKAIPAFSIDSLVSYYKHADAVMVVNFWSTWCKPCVEEIPHFLEVTNHFKNDNVTLTLVSQDTKALYESGKLLAYIKSKKWQQADFVWLNETNADYYCPKVDESWSGVIPATVIINPAKNYFRFFEESLSAGELEAEIKKAIKG